MPANTRPIKTTLQEYGRALAGGLLFSAASLYTMEIWWQGYTVPSHVVLVRFLGSLVLLTAYVHAAGILDSDTLWAEIAEALEALALGFAVAAVMLKLSGQLPPGVSWAEAMQRLAMSGTVTAIGVAVGTKQLGQADDSDDDEDSDDSESDDSDESAGSWHRELSLTVLGAFLLGTSVAPTEEILMIGVEAPGWAPLATAVVSFGIALGIVSYIAFRGASDADESRFAGGPLGDAVVTYAGALRASAAMLWSTGQFGGLGAIAIMDLVIYLGLPCALGASAGRLLL